MVQLNKSQEIDYENTLQLLQKAKAILNIYTQLKKITQAYSTIYQVSNQLYQLKKVGADKEMKENLVRKFNQLKENLIQEATAFRNEHKHYTFFLDNLEVPNLHEESC
mmetsp:Transcript_10828/g.10953  ORF Transcript_10828/g.10953 Transcript_10828/m.10953 type:complete len:108 (-) Transcript_10828:4-327(-)